VEINPNEHNKKRRRSKSRTPQKQRNKKKPPQLNKQKTTTPHTKHFNCYTIHIRGLTQQKWKVILNHPSTKDPHAIVVTEHHLPFGHTPSYVTTSGWVFHTIQAPFKKDKDGNLTLGTRGGIEPPLSSLSYTCRRFQQMGGHGTRRTPLQPPRIPTHPYSRWGPSPTM